MRPIFFLSILIILSSVQDSQSTDRHKLKKLRENIFTKKSSEGLVDTDNHLIKLNDFYSQMSAENSLTNDDKNDASIINNLLNMKKPKEANCKDSFYEAFGLMKNLAGKSPRLLEYIGYFLRQQLNLCYPKTLAELNEGVESFSNQEKEEMHRLYLAYKSAKKRKEGEEVYKAESFLRFPQDVIIEAILSYIGPISHLPKDVSRARDQFEHKFITSVEFLCGKADRSIKKPSQLLKNVGYFEETLSVLDSFAQEWVQMGNVCQEIWQELNLFKEKSLKILVKGSGGTMKSFFKSQAFSA